MFPVLIHYVLNGIRNGMRKFPFAKSYKPSEVVKLGRWGYHWEVN